MSKLVLVGGCMMIAAGIGGLGFMFYALVIR